MHPLVLLVAGGLVVWGLADLVMALWHLLRALCVLLFGVVPATIRWLVGR